MTRRSRYAGIGGQADRRVVAHLGDVRPASNS
jgi:hypothetical protein